MRLGLLAASFVASISVGVSANAATLQVDSFGRLTGASDVVVGSEIYSVAFDGSPYCSDAFGTCDSSTVWAFSTAAGAEAAAYALLDQVFVDGPEGSFNSGVGNVLGCGGSDAQALCVASIPYAYDEELGLDNVLRSAVAANVQPSNGDDYVSIVTGSNWIRGSAAKYQTWAVFSQTGLVPDEPGSVPEEPGPVTAPVPVPASGLMLLLAIGSGCWLNRKRMFNSADV